ncbi:MAG: 30S ribosomal protein S5 [Elusimicrobiota bacterium]
MNKEKEVSVEPMADQTPVGLIPDKAEGEEESVLFAPVSKAEVFSSFKETVVSIKRVTKVVSGGKRMAFSSLVVVGNGEGQVGIGKGKARDVQMSILKATNQAKKHLTSVPLVNYTIPYPIIGNYGSARVLLRPAAPGTGVIAGGVVRALLEACGVKNILTKSLGTSNPHNVIHATLNAFSQLKTKEDVAKRRGRKPEEL